MTPSPPLLVLATLLDLFEERLRAGAEIAPGDLLLAGKQLHRLNGLYIRLVEMALEAATRDRVRD